jgi:drug/metabolite transporter (DMT)-like permease
MPNATKSLSTRAGYVHAFLCTFFAGVLITLIKIAENELPTFSVLLLTLGIAALVLSAVILVSGRGAQVRALSARGWIWLAGISALTFFSYWTLFAAIDLLDPTVASFLGRTETLVTIFFGVVFLGERFRRKEIAGALLVLAGTIVIRYAGGVAISRGFFLCILAAFCWGISEGLAKVALRAVEPLVFTWGRCLLLAPVFLAAAAASPEGIVLPRTAETWWAVIGVALAGPVVARYLYLKSLTVLPVSRVALIHQFQPIWVAAAAGILLKTIPTAREWAGGALIIMGCLLLVNLRENRRVLRSAARTTSCVLSRKRPRRPD